MKKLKQILALAAVVLLLALYAAAFIFAMMKSEAAQVMFRGAVGATILVPVLLYLFLMVARTVRPAKSPVIDAVVFDVGNVLVEWTWRDMAEDLGISDEAAAVFGEKVFGSSLWSEYDRGVQSEEEALAGFAKVIPAEYEEQLGKLIGAIDDSYSEFWYTRDWIRGLKRKGYKVYILSNWSRKSHDYIEQKGLLDFVKLADGAVWSFACHYIKPEKEIYSYLFKTYGIDPSRAVFIDDNPENVAAARKCGMSAIQFTDYNDAVEKLEAVGVRW